MAPTILLYSERLISTPTDAFCACKRPSASFRTGGIARQKNSMYHSWQPLSASHLGSAGPSLSRGLTLDQGDMFLE